MAPTLRWRLAIPAMFITLPFVLIVLVGSARGWLDSDLEVWLFSAALVMAEVGGSLGTLYLVARGVRRRASEAGVTLSWSDAAEVMLTRSEDEMRRVLRNKGVPEDGI